jgi:signal transduction histidine kinase
MKAMFSPDTISEAYLNLIDVILLALIVAPALYFLVFRRMQKEIEACMQIAAGLESHHYHLEELVQTRTAELVRARNAAESERHAKNAFIANISHEIRISLNSIIDYPRLGQITTIGQKRMR